MSSNNLTTVPSSTSTASVPSTTSTSTPSETTPSTTSTTSTSTPETTSTPTPTTTSISSSTETTPTETIPTTSSIPSTTSIESTTSTPEPTSTTEESTETTPTSSSTHTTTFLTSVPVTTTQAVTSDGSTAFITVTSFVPTTSTGVATEAASATSSGASLISSGHDNSSSGGLGTSGKIAVSVIAPIAGVALLVVAGIFFWRKRKQRKDAEEERRKEVEDYNYNPNNDPTLPDVSSIGGAGAYEMKEDGSSGYRGWGSTTLAGSTGRKASTNMSGGAAGAPYSDANYSPTRGNTSDTRSGEPLMGDGSNSPEGEILGAMGPTAADTRGGHVQRGTSNASSSYSAAGRSDGSEPGVAYGGPPYYDQYGGANEPYDGSSGQQPPGDAGGQPIIRDNPARRNTRIENPSHYPQQSAGISQNF